MAVFTAADPSYKHNNEYFANLIKKHIPARNLTDLLFSPFGAEAEYWRLVNMGTIPDALGNFRNTAPTAAMQAGAGTAPPSAVISAGSKDFSGQITFGTGTTPAPGNVVQIVFGGGAYPVAPFVQVTPTNAGTAGAQLYVASVSTTSFTVGVATTLAASQGNTVFAFSYRVG